MRGRSLNVMGFLVLVWLSSALTADAAVTGWTTTSYLRRLLQVYNTYPLMISVWGYDPSATTAESNMVAIGQDGQNNNRRAVVGLLATTREVFALSRITSSNFAQSASARPADTWFHAFGDWPSAGSRRASLNGVAGTASGNTLDVAASDSVKIGVRSDNTTPYASGGALAEVSIWAGTGMDETNRHALRDKLHTGGNPLAITAEAAQPWTGMLVAYWRLSTHTDLNDLSGNGHTLDAVGTNLSTFGTHPPVDSVPGEAPTSFGVLRRRH